MNASVKRTADFRAWQPYSGGDWCLRCDNLTVYINQYGDLKNIGYPAHEETPHALLFEVRRVVSIAVATYLVDHNLTHVRVRARSDDKRALVSFIALALNEMIPPATWKDT